MVLSVTFSPCHKINSPFLPFKPLLLYVCQSFPNSKTDDTSLLKSNKERLKKRKLLFVQLFPQCCRIPLIWCTSKVFKDIDPYLLKLFNLKKKNWLLLNTAEIISADVSNLQFVTLKDLSASQHPHSWHLGEFTMFFLTYPCSLSVSLSITCFCSSPSPRAPPMSLLARFTSACQSTVSPCLCSWDFCARDLHWSPPLPRSPSLHLLPPPSLPPA